MSELDVDIRAVSNASFGGRAAISDPVQAPTGDQSGLTSQPIDTQTVQPSVASDASGTSAAIAKPSVLYDSFRFMYRTDYGRIVLVDQDPETGKPISQIPSQRALQLYAEQHRSEEQATTSVLSRLPKTQAGTGSGSSHHDFVPSQPGPAPSLDHAISGGRGAAQPVVTAPQTPQAPAPALAASSFSPVNITI
jgi:hypothetical protein